MTTSITDMMNESLNKQITSELTASHAYLAMACCFDEMGLKVFASRFHEQAVEERGHAIKILNYVHEVGGKVVIDALPAPKNNFDSALAIVEGALKNEMTVTRQIHDLVALAEKEKDYATQSFLKWFVDEQVEEVATMSDLINLIKLAGKDNLFHVETRLAAGK